MEVWGSGYKRCMEDCRLGDYLAPEWLELGAAVRVTFSPHQRTLTKEPQPPQEVLHELLERQKTILSLFQLTLRKMLGIWTEAKVLEVDISFGTQY
jgi:ATP-dependent DNA helicase RecG